MVAKSKPNELMITRLYDAPVAAVWDAWTDPAQTAQWWGPRGFTLTTHSKDLRVGGHWHYTMHGPDGTDYPNHTVYHEVEPHKRLVYDHGGYGDRPPLFRVTVTFEQKGEQTEMIMIMALPTAEAAAQTKKFVKDAGGNGTWDRLAEYLAAAKDQNEIFVMNRSFEAPIHRLYDMWTKPELLSAWSTPVASRFGPQQPKSERPQYLEYAFTIEEHEQKVLARVFFIPEDGEGTTRITLVVEPCGPFAADVRKSFAAKRNEMASSWTQAFDKLEAYLSV